MTRFEDLIGWQKSRKLFKLTHDVTSKSTIFKDFTLRDQMRRSSLSVMSNVAEGFDRGGDKEFIQFLFYAKGSCSELRSQLHAARDVGHLNQDDLEVISELAEETSKILQGLIKTMNKKGINGTLIQMIKILYTLHFTL